MSEFKKHGEFVTVWVGGIGLLQCEEIVRCRDCKWSVEESRWCNRASENHGAFDWMPTTPDGFCLWGARRDG